MRYYRKHRLIGYIILPSCCNNLLMALKNVIFHIVVVKDKESCYPFLGCIVEPLVCVYNSETEDFFNQPGIVKMECCPFCSTLIILDHTMTLPPDCKDINLTPKNGLVSN